MLTLKKTMKFSCLVVVLLLAIGFCRSLPQPMQNGMEYFENSIIVDPMLIDIQDAMDYRGYLYSAYFWKYVVPTLKNWNCIKWNKPKKHLEESFYPKNKKGSYNNGDDGLFQRKNSKVSAMPKRKTFNVSNMPF